MGRMKIKWFLSLVSLVLLVSACADSNATDDKGNGWPEKLVIVTMPDENNPEAGGKNKKFEQDMSDYLGIEVEQMEGADYAVGIEAMKSQQLDILLVSPMSLHQATKRVEKGVEPVATTKSGDAEEYKTVFVAKSDNDEINDLKDLEGKNFAFVDPASSSGYLYPKYTLVKELGLEPNQMEESNYFFKTVAYSGKHDTSLMGVAKGDYDAAAVAKQIISMMTDSGLVKEDDFKIIGETSVIPNALYIMRSDLPDDLKEKIKEFYLQYEDEEYFETFYKDKTTRFTEVDLADYSETNDMLKTLNVEED
ncbi:phosphate/phosphite/phosphonate ABC transporter substrate-binding protein [Vagococcus elongatus]|uniref:Phosphate ABC transporter substrate-binding protein n=1 Tax=Vagococcus elongatus TaxID=180344 RepID=A0A430B5Z7_9ENTE|nr:phosphate/phosphite/phosphonate ABC transporter substrate-binding protein [Vagococcus elongatus]RSU15717.1 phosphate ABC transporter substrate-binding protein [Vagococcus elongatus]